MRVVVVMVGLALCAGYSAAASRKRQCARACGGLIAACAADATDHGYGELERGCRAAVLRRCTHEGPGACGTYCGDGVTGAGETCDGTDLGGQSCEGLGFVGGGLGCTAGCVFDTAGCVAGAFLASGQTASLAGADDGALQRGAPLRYRDNDDGTITDANTGLMWEKKGGEAGLHYRDNHLTWTPGPGSVWEWVGLVNAEGGGAGFAGHDDWRLPNVRELQSLVDYGHSAGAVAAEFRAECTPGCAVTRCSCTEASVVWTSTTFGADPAYAWFVDFANGFVGNDLKGAVWHVRAVRGP